MPSSASPRAANQREQNDSSLSTENTDRQRRRRRLTTPEKERRRSYKSETSRRSFTPPPSSPREEKRQVSMPVPELDRQTTLTSASSRSGRPYPTLSKAHAREDLTGKAANNDSKSSLDKLTPDATVAGIEEQERSKQQASPTKPKYRSSDSKRPTTPLSASKDVDTNYDLLNPKLRASGYGQTKSNGSPIRNASPTTRRASQPSGSRESPTKKSPDKTTSDSDDEDIFDISSRPTSSYRRGERPSRTPLTSAVNSDGTAKVQPERKRFSIRTNDARLNYGDSGSDSSRQTATPTPRDVPPQQGHKPDTNGRRTPKAELRPVKTPEPPPTTPQPAAMFSADAHKVDYLVQHGGLRQPIPRNFLDTTVSIARDADTLQNASNAADLASHSKRVFASYSRRLDDFSKVLSKNGSVAVATGYRSVARRLLDRLEKVFARDLSAERCRCIMCNDQEDMADDAVRGLSWGEVLEYVSGRKELPEWPVFVLQNDKTEEVSANLKPPMQKLDVDVPDEWREHYLAQSKKTKESVDKWLAGQTDEAEDRPPLEADDDTLMFAILTHLDAEDQPLYRDLLGMASTRPRSVHPNSELGTTDVAPELDMLTKLGRAIQRLYRLQSPPRAPETALYLLNYHHLHNVLATIAAISDAEWEVLVSGRFDGFLRSGAEDSNTIPRSSPSYLSRGDMSSLNRTASGNQSVSSLHSSMTATPIPSTAPAGAAGGPIGLDEEAEIAALAEVEREIFLGMEALEDAFEALHDRAEIIRKNLRDRAAGLHVAAQLRRAATNGASETSGVRMATSAENDKENGYEGMEFDAMSELGPNDSASQISSSRRRRPKRRDERRKPARIDEAGEDENEPQTQTQTPPPKPRFGRLEELAMRTKARMSR